MSWDMIENVAAPKAGMALCVPPKGVRVRVRQMGGKAGKSVRYIHLSIGVALAKSLCLTLPKIGVRLSLGGGDHAGQLALSVDNGAGNFVAKRGRDGGYALTINAASADGLFSLDFAPFTVEEATIIHARDVPPLAAFRAPPAMLAVD